MALDETHRRALADTAAQLLEAITAVARRAGVKLAEVRGGSAEHVIAGGTNPIVDGNRATRNLGALLAGDRAQLERLTREPLVARLVVEWADQPDTPQTIYVARGSAAGLSDAAPNGMLVTYTAALGRLAEFPAGETTDVTVGGQPREALIRERVQLRPERRDDVWDGLDDKFEFPSWQASVESLLAILDHLRPGPGELDLVSALRKEAAEEQIIRKTRRRAVIQGISLRDQPILDRYQGEVFRMPLDRQLLLLGPPGTGKTTTLIRRLAQKRTPEGRSEEESDLLSRTGLDAAFASPQSWVMFSPTELLSLYLLDAFSREGVAAVRGVNLRTWDSERLTLARNILGILRSAETGVFQLDDRTGVLADASSAGLAFLSDEFGAFVERTVLDETSAGLQELEQSAADSIGRAVAELRRRLGQKDRLAIPDLVRLVDAGAEILQPEIRRLDEDARAAADRSASRLLTTHPGLLDDLAHSLPSLMADDGVVSDHEEADEDDDVDEGDLLPPSRDTRMRALAVLLSAIRTAARAAALGRSRPGGRTGRVLEFLQQRQVYLDDLSSLGRLLITRGRLRTVRRAPRRFVMGVPRLYAAFRRAAIREGRLYGAAASDMARQNRISPHETDVLVLTMLRNARAVADGPVFALPDWLEGIGARQFTQVFVDEATDFSGVQLACMMELAHPQLRSWFACGDLLQRVTLHGVRDLSDVAWTTRGAAPPEVRHVRIGYRQSRRLRELATALAGQVEATLEAPDGREDADIWPLLAEHHTGDGLGAWLANRILDVERAVGYVPSVAVFVDGDDRIDPLVAATSPALEGRNVRIVGSKDGRDLGDAQEVRVFDVRHIKGLEFEAVFFVGVDQLAERLPDLFDRYLYVGVTRAATYLGITCETSLPSRLEFARPYLGDAALNPW